MNRKETAIRSSKEESDIIFGKMFICKNSEGRKCTKQAVKESGDQRTRWMSDNSRSHKCVWLIVIKGCPVGRQLIAFLNKSQSISYEGERHPILPYCGWGKGSPTR